MADLDKERVERINAAQRSEAERQAVEALTEIIKELEGVGYRMKRLSKRLAIIMRQPDERWWWLLFRERFLIRVRTPDKIEVTAIGPRYYRWHHFFRGTRAEVFAHLGSILEYKPKWEFTIKLSD